MTAEEKAKELVNKYYCAKDSIGLSYCINYSNAKAAALIAVDEIIHETTNIFNITYAANMYAKHAMNKIKYWQEVTQEIEKL